MGIDHLQKGNWQNLKTFIEANNEYLNRKCFNFLFKMDWPQINCISIHTPKVFNYNYSVYSIYNSK